MELPKRKRTTDAASVAPLIDFTFEPIMRAKEVIGDEQEALRWLGTPVRALNYATPISLLSSREGQQAVLQVLDKLEHGVF